jgi:hypothetical protein
MSKRLGPEQRSYQAKGIAWWSGTPSTSHLLQLGRSEDSEMGTLLYLTTVGSIVQVLHLSYRRYMSLTLPVPVPVSVPFPLSLEAVQ